MNSQAVRLAGEERERIHALGPVEYAIDIVSLSKIFKRQQLTRAGYTTLKSSLFRIFSRQNLTQAHLTHAVHDLTVRIPQGSALGIIGRNGSGKSTLLKLITGIYKPTRGSVSVRGRIAALIELGAGFHPDFTGRENLYLGGVMHGLTRDEIDERFDDIVEFAELAHVIDDPIRTYSSGMFMRLGFSLAVHTNPDILIIDEVLAVGDAAFVAKCKEKIARLHRDGKTLLLVTHDLEAVERWCNEVVWLDEGKVKDRGDPRRVIDHYREFIEHGEERELREQAVEEEVVEDAGAAQTTVQEGFVERATRWGSREVEITSVRLLSSTQEEKLLFHPDDAVQIQIAYQLNENVSDVVFGIGLHRSDGLTVHGSNTDIEGVKLPALGKRGVLAYEVSRLGLLEGHYSLDVAVHRKDGYPFDYHQSALKFAIRSPLKQLGVVAPEHTWRLMTRGEEKL